MLYHKHSFNYFVRIMGYMRARVLLSILLRAGSWGRDLEQMKAGLIGVRGNQNRKIWEIHYQNFLKSGWSYLRARNFIHHCTDGPECPVAYAFSKSGARKLFSRFRSVEMKVAHFPLKRYRQGLPFGLEKFLAATMGWYLFIFAHKAGGGLQAPEG